MDPTLRESILNAVYDLNNWSQKLILIGNRSSTNHNTLDRDQDLDISCAVGDEAVTPPSVDSLVSNYWVITGKYWRILRFLVFLLRYGLYRGKDGIIVCRLENSG